MHKKTLSLLLSAAMILSLCACGDTASPIDTGEDMVKKNINSIPIRYPNLTEDELAAAAGQMDEGTDFSEISYSRYDDSDLQELIKLIQAKTEDAANASEVASLFDSIIENEYELLLSYKLADLYGALDVTDEYYQTESVYNTELLYTIQDQIDSLGKAILNSPCGPEIEKVWEPEDVEYYRDYVELTPEQLALVSKETELKNKYEELSTETYTVKYKGMDYTLEDIYTDSEMTNEEYYTTYYQLMEKKNKVLGPIYVELVKVRQDLAKSYGYDNYVDYAYEEIYERDYTPNDSLQLAKNVRQYYLPVFYLLYATYNQRAGESLDKAFAQISIEDQLEMFRSYLPRIDQSLLTTEQFMETYHLYDLDYSDTKLDAGFTTFLTNYNEPFLFHQKGGDFYDFTTLVHEFGHFNSFYLNWENADQEQSIDLAEIHSQGLELLYSNYYREMFGNICGKAASTYNLVQVMSSVFTGCMYDEFQQAVYALDNPTLDEINKAFCRISETYGYDHKGDTMAYEWVNINHNFSQPMYYISYAVSALPAIEIWQISQEDPEKAIDLYFDLVTAGEGGGYQETLKSCGLGIPFTSDYMVKMVDMIRAYIKTL